MDSSIDAVDVARGHAYCVPVRSPHIRWDCEYEANLRCDSIHECPLSHHPARIVRQAAGPTRPRRRMGMAHLWHRQGIRSARRPGRLAAIMMTVRLLRRLFSADVLGLILVLVVLQAFVYGLGSSLRTTDTSDFFWVCLLAALIGFGLSKRKLNGIPAAIGMILMGLIGVWILGARLTGPLLEVGRAILEVLPEVGPAIRAQTSVDTTAIAERWAIVTLASNALSMRVQTWFSNQSQDVLVNDPLARNLVWVFIVWLVAAWLGWFAQRRNAMAALLPCIALLSVILSYSEYRVEALWVIVIS